MFTETCVLLEQRVSSDSEAINRIGQQLVECDYILPSYIDSTVSREAEYPTAIDFGTISIAIPHSTPNNNVEKDCIGVLKLDECIVFNSMAGNEKLDVNMVFLLALKDGKKHMEILSKFMGMFQDESFVKKLSVESNKEVIVNLLNQKMEE